MKNKYRKIVSIIVVLVFLLTFWRRILLSLTCIYFCATNNFREIEPIQNVSMRVIENHQDVYDFGIITLPKDFGEIKSIYRFLENIYIETEDARIHIAYTYWGLDAYNDDNVMSTASTVENVIKLMQICTPFHWDYSIASMTVSETFQSIFGSNLQLELTAVRAKLNRQFMSKGREVRFLQMPYSWCILRGVDDSGLFQCVLWDKIKNLKLQITVDVLDGEADREKQESFISGSLLNPDIPHFLESDIRLNLFEEYLDIEYSNDDRFKIMDIDDLYPFILNFD